MNITFAVDRLYDTGWHPSGDLDLERLADGRSYPSVLLVQREFSRAGLELAIKHNMMFSCYRATWAPAGEPLEESRAATCDRALDASLAALAGTSALNAQLAAEGRRRRQDRNVSVTA